MSDWPPIDQAFEEFWAIAVRKVGKADARKAVIKVWKRGVSWQKFYSDWRRHNEEMKNQPLKYVPYPATFLNREEFTEDAPRLFASSVVPCSGPQQVHIKVDTPQWTAWTKYLGKSLPQDRQFGWFVDQEWPPDHAST